MVQITEHEKLQEEATQIEEALAPARELLKAAHPDHALSKAVEIMEQAGETLQNSASDDTEARSLPWKIVRAAGLFLLDALPQSQLPSLEKQEFLARAIDSTRSGQPQTNGVMLKLTTAKLALSTADLRELESRDVSLPTQGLAS